jgi:hypothetical protein
MKKFKEENNFSYEINMKGMLENEKLNELFIDFLKKSLKNESKLKQILIKVSQINGTLSTNIMEIFYLMKEKLERL